MSDQSAGQYHFIVLRNRPRYAQLPDSVICGRGLSPDPRIEMTASAALGASVFDLDSRKILTRMLDLTPATS